MWKLCKTEKMTSPRRSHILLLQISCFDHMGGVPNLQLASYNLSIQTKLHKIRIRLWDFFVKHHIKRFSSNLDPRLSCTRKGANWWREKKQSIYLYSFQAEKNNFLACMLKNIHYFYIFICEKLTVCKHFNLITNLGMLNVVMALTYWWIIN